MKYPHPWRRLGALACTAALTLTLIPAASASGGGYRQSGSLDMDKLSRQEIAALLADNSLELPGQLFEEEPSVTAPYRAGRVTDQALQAAVDRLNALRRIAGVPDVALDSALSENAQYGAVLLAASHFSHSPAQPADMDGSFYQTASEATGSSNICAGRSLTGSVDAFMDDSDAGNIDRLGHRRWQLNPDMGRIGFGYAYSGASRYGAYVAEKVFDRSGAGCDYDFIAWPASGDFPAQEGGTTLFGGSCAWSVTLNPQTYQTPSLSDVTVTLTRESDGRTWTLDSGTRNTSGDYFNVDTGGYGVSNCIIFRPSGVDRYEGVYTVEIDGLRTIGGGAVTDFAYQVAFFDAAQSEPEPTPEPTPEPEPEPGTETSFADVPASAWYAQYAQEAARAGLMTGTAQTRFSPDQTLSVAEVVTLAARLHAERQGETVPQRPGAWYLGAYTYCVDEGLFTTMEVPSGILEQPATRFQMVELLDRAVPDSEKTAIHGDAAAPDVGPDSPYQEVVNRWYQAGITQGDQSGNFNGENSITRAETAAILCRLAGLTPRV